MISSKSNSRIKEIRRLRERKVRQENGLFYLEGLRIVGEAVHQAIPLEVLIVSPDLLTSQFGWQLVQSQSERHVPVLEVTADVFRSLSLKEGPQGIAAVAHQRWYSLQEIIVAPETTWVALDSVADPGNLGAILRTHDAVGGEGVILLDQATDPYDPTAVRASMGAIFCQKLVKASFSEFAEWKAGTGIPVVGTSGQAEKDYHQVCYPPRLVLLMGSERHGLQAHHQKICDSLVRIPMIGRSDSLNLAVATAVVLYEIFNKRRDGVRSS